MTTIDWGRVPVLAWAQAQERATVELIRKMAEIETPSDDPAALRRFADWFSSQIAPSFGMSVRAAPGGHLLVRFSQKGADESGQLLVLGHYDTVWPVGTLAGMPVQERDGRLWGPGVLDMKGGIAMALMAIKAIQELRLPMRSAVLLQLNADEETGSRTSRELTERNAQASRAVLVVEPGTGLTGKCKTSRKGVGEYRVEVHGIASHAGVDFAAGASATLELSRQLLRIATFTDLEQGTTVNPGVVSGGTRSNVVASEAQARIDVRVEHARDGAIVDEKFRTLQPVDTRCSLTISGGLNRPPMERSPQIVELFERARALAGEIGMQLEQSSTGGGSDGNFTAALGIPTLDGMGAVGEGAHAAHESILVNRIADRTALLAMLLATL